MLNFNWTSTDEATFQGHLSKYTNAFKGFQTRYFVLDAHAKHLFYFMPDEIRKKGPRGVIELADCWIAPSNEDDVTFTIQTGNGDAFKLRAGDAKERQRWIDKLRTCSGTTAAQILFSSQPSSKTQQTNVSLSPFPSGDTHARPTSRHAPKLSPNQQTLQELKEVIRCVEVSQREFVETIYMIPDDMPFTALSKDMLLLRSLSQSCVNSLQDALAILTRRRTPDNDLLSSSSNTSQLLQSSSPASFYKQMSQPLNSSTSGKSNTSTGGLSQSVPATTHVHTKTSNSGNIIQSNENSTTTKESKK